MSKTDKTKPWKVVHGGGECPGYGGYPCPCLSSRGAVKVYRRKHTRHSRTQLRADVAHGNDPSIDQHRHRAVWEAW